MNTRDIIGLIIFLSAVPILAVIAYFKFRSRAKHEPDPSKDMTPGSFGTVSNIDPLCFYDYLHHLVQPDSIIFLLEADSRYHTILSPYLIPLDRLRRRSGILSDERGWHMPVTKELLSVLSTEMHRVPLRGGDCCQLGWVIILYDAQGIYLEWANPPDEPIYIALRIPKKSVESFAENAKNQKEPIDISPWNTL